MNISLTPELEKFVQEKVTGGMYTSASEVIRESLRLMHTYNNLQKQRINEISRAIDIGMQQLTQKQFTDGQTSKEKMKRKIDILAKEKQ